MFTLFLLFLDNIKIGFWKSTAPSGTALEAKKRGVTKSGQSKVLKSTVFSKDPSKGEPDFPLAPNKLSLGRYLLL
jgi:hypothetical protein